MGSLCSESFSYFLPRTFLPKLKIRYKMLFRDEKREANLLIEQKMSVDIHPKWTLVLRVSYVQISTHTQTHTLYIHAIKETTRWMKWMISLWNVLKNVFCNIFPREMYINMWVCVCLCLFSWKDYGISFCTDSACIPRVLLYKYINIYVYLSLVVLHSYSWVSGGL